MVERYSAHFLTPAREYIEHLPSGDQGTIAADVASLRSGDRQIVHTKRLRGEIRELISGHHRLTYFCIGAALYFVRGFRKKSTKTPKREIEYAEQIYKLTKKR